MKIANNANTNFVSSGNNPPNPKKPSFEDNLLLKKFEFGSDKLAFNTPFQTSAITNISFDTVEDLSLKYSEPVRKLINLGEKYGVPFSEGTNLDEYQTKVVKAIITAKSKELGIPANIAIGMAGHESGWSMWEKLDSKKPILVQGKNVITQHKKRILLSTDWGVMQVNDKAHAKAFPKAKDDLEYNIEFGLRFLKGVRAESKGNLKLGLGDWDKTVAAYNLGHSPTSRNELSIAKKYVSAVRKMSLK